MSLAVAIFEICYVSSRADYFTQKINVCDSCINGGEYQKAEELMQEIEKEWADSTKITDILLIHDYVDSIGSDISAMRSYAKSKSGDEYFAESARAKKELASIRESEYVIWENIF